MVAALLAAELVCRTQTVWLPAMVPAAVVNAPAQPTEYSPPVTVIAAGASMPVIVTAADVTTVDRRHAGLVGKGKGVGRRVRRGRAPRPRVVLVKVSLTPPTVSVVLVGALLAAALVCRTQIV